jgi:hypothetical protein
MLSSDLTFAELGTYLGTYLKTPGGHAGSHQSSPATSLTRPSQRQALTIQLASGTGRFHVLRGEDRSPRSSPPNRYSTGASKRFYNVGSAFPRVRPQRSRRPSGRLGQDMASAAEGVDGVEVKCSPTGDRGIVDHQGRNVGDAKRERRHRRRPGYRLPAVRRGRQARPVVFYRASEAPRLRESRPTAHRSPTRRSCECQPRRSIACTVGHSRPGSQRHASQVVVPRRTSRGDAYRNGGKAYPKLTFRPEQMSVF